MLRALCVAILAFVVWPASSVQESSVLHITVTLIDADQKITPVLHHTLLISENPASAAPRSVVTGVDGTAVVKLRPGNYTVESDRPVAFNGKAYQWTQMLDIVAGKDATLQLTVDNAEIEAVSTTTTTSGRPLEADPAFLLPRWQDSVVGIWTPTTHASGFAIDSNGLIATSQRVLGASTSVEVQLTPTVKVTGVVLVSDIARDVAVLRIDPQVMASMRPVPLPCDQTATLTVERGQEIFAIGVPLRQRKGLTSGTVKRVSSSDFFSDFILPRGSAGGPVFTARGDLVGVTSIVQDRNDPDRSIREDAPIVRSASLCGALASAAQKMTGSAAPSGTPLPLEPTKPFPVDALKSAAERRVGSLSPYQIAASTFDVAFITPMLVYGAQYQAEQTNRRGRNGGRMQPPEPTLVRPLLDFSTWSDYVSEFPPVLLVRVTPKMVEGFWTTVGRAAARTQGVALPPLKHVSSGFLKLRAFCGETEVTPIHPFKLEQRVSESDAVYEGLYVFDPGALRPDCGSVKVMLYSEKEPDKAETRVVDPKIVQQIWDDFAPYRSPSQ